MLPKSPATLEVGRGVPTAPPEVVQFRTFRAPSDDRGAVGTPRRYPRPGWATRPFGGDFNPSRPAQRQQEVLVTKGRRGEAGVLWPDISRLPVVLPITPSVPPPLATAGYLVSDNNVGWLAPDRSAMYRLDRSSSKTVEMSLWKDQLLPGVVAFGHGPVLRSPERRGSIPRSRENYESDKRANDRP